MNWMIGALELPGDLEWIDEYLPVVHQAEFDSLAGGVIVQRSRKTGGMPITLTTPERVYVTRQAVLDLIALRDDPETDVFTVAHPDGREFQCRFRHRDGLPVDPANTYFRSPPEPDDAWHILTLRLMIV